MIDIVVHPGRLARLGQIVVMNQLGNVVEHGPHDVANAQHFACCVRQRQRGRGEGCHVEVQRAQFAVLRRAVRQQPRAGRAAASAANPRRSLGRRWRG